MSASPEALAAVRAVKNLKKWGPFAAMRFAQKRGAWREFVAAASFELMRRGRA